MNKTKSRKHGYTKCKIYANYTEMSIKTCIPNPDIDRSEDMSRVKTKRQVMGN